jgi:hypothetical protein
MRRFISKLVACVLLALSIGTASNVARAVDYGDVWWVATEGGWGLQTSQQGSLIFMTFYVYGATGQATWFTALVSPTTPGGSTFTGALNAYTGPYYGAPWNSALVNSRVAGTVTFTATSPTTATLTYTADGVTVTKSIQRFTFSSQNISGTYIGSFLAVQHNCTVPAANGQTFTGSGTFTILHVLATQQVTITATLSDNLHNFVCTYSGTYSQAGRLGSISGGNYTCNDGHAGAFSATEIELASVGGILGRYSGTYVAPGCQLTGGFGGLPAP